MAKKKVIVVPDTSVVAEAVVSRYLDDGFIKPDTILIPQAVMQELEHQANNNRDIGYIGLDEIRDLNERKDVKVEFTEDRYGQFELEHADSGAVDHIIREVARKHNATLMTADRVQAAVARAEGVKVEFVSFSRDHEVQNTDPLKDFFTDTTMSLHLREDAKTITKVGKPGAWKFTKSDHTPDRNEMQALSKQITEAAQIRHDSFMEIERRGSSIVQLGRYRIVIARPPFASAWEITAVRPVAHLGLKDYDFPEKFQERLEERAEGILVAGSPGEGKSTFAQALGEFYDHKDKIVKTVEAPRDLVLPGEITQYSASHGSPEEIRDVLLLNRPDYTIYDEIRNNSDFSLFADMRMAGVGMIGVIHGSSPVDSIQRFVGRIELGMIPQIVDTVVFIKAGGIAKVYSLAMTVKTPAGMTDSDLARPVIVIKDFFADKAEYEMYTYGDQTVVIPVDAVTAQGEQKPLYKFAEQGLVDYFKQFSKRAKVKITGDNAVTVYVPENQIAGIIGKGGSTIQEIEKDLGMKVDVQSSANAGKEATAKAGGDVKWDARVGKKNITITLAKGFDDKEVDIYDGKTYIATVHSSKRGDIKVTHKSDVGRKIKKALESDTFEVRG